MKLIDSKYLFILFGVLLVLFLSFAYMSYGVVVKKSTPKSTAEVIDSLQSALKERDEKIRMLQDEIGTLKSQKENRRPSLQQDGNKTQPEVKNQTQKNASARFEGF